MKNLKAVILMTLLTNSILYSGYPAIKFYTNNAWYVGFEYPAVSDNVLKDLKELKLLRELVKTDDSIINNGADLLKAKKKKNAAIIAGTVGGGVGAAIIAGFVGFVVGIFKTR